MSNETSQTTTSEPDNGTRDAYAKAFNRPSDPLEKYSERFYSLPDPFEYFIKEVLIKKQDIESEKTISEYRRTYRQWKNHMEPKKRHPACPSPTHVSEFIEWRRDVHQNCRRFINAKLNRLVRAYEHWQIESVFPHPNDFNPFELARERTDLGTNNNKHSTIPHYKLFRIPLQLLRTYVVEQLSLHN